MSQSSGRVAGKMKWLVARYPKAPGALIALGAILTDPEEPESRLNRHDAKAVEDKDTINETTAVQRTIQADVSSDNSVLLKVAQPLLGAGLFVEGKLTKDRKTVVEALDVKAKIYLPDKAYMDASVQVPSVQAHLKEKHFSTPLYMIIGVATANKLSIDEETSQQGSVGGGGSFAPPGAQGTEVSAEAHHGKSRSGAVGLKVEEECDFAYRIREFTYWEARRKKVKDKGDRSTGALFQGGNTTVSAAPVPTANTTDDDGDESSSDDDDDDEETFASFNSLKEDDVGGKGLVDFEATSAAEEASTQGSTT